jgi:mono/diheme cytochrome c family protein
MKSKNMYLKVGSWAVGVLVALAVVATALIYSGVYNVGADIPHTKLTYWLFETVRDHSVSAHARGISVPNLDSPTDIAEGAGEYAEMCSQCHLAPGMTKTEISQGLYPQPPQLSQGTDLSSAEEFWILKHGIKMTAMPAWGVTHSDKLLWNIVAFLRKLPSLSPAQYQALVKSAPESHDEMMEHQDHD